MKQEIVDVEIECYSFFKDRQSLDFNKDIVDNIKELVERLNVSRDCI